MKKVLLMAALFAASAAFVGCSKDKDEKDDGLPKCWQINTKIKFFGTSVTTGYYFWGTKTEAEAEVREEKANTPVGSVSKKKSSRSEDDCWGIVGF